jgi:diaminopimelate epimerase
MKIDFIQMQGAGNDYLYIDCMTHNLSLSARAIAFLSDRHFGVGGDGVIFVRPSTVADAYMDMYNADGSRGAMCGNGIRCVGKLLSDRGYTTADVVTVETLSGVRTLRLIKQGKAATGAMVEMGSAVLHCPDIPVLHTGSNIDIPLIVDGVSYQVTCVSMGNPHAVLFVDDPNRLDLAALGPRFEHHPFFSDRVNTEFVRVAGPQAIDMRVWERGAGETLACGTGACAAAVAAVLKGYCAYAQPITVRLPGGQLDVTYSSSGLVTMRGDAVEVFSGSLSLVEELTWHS